MKVLVVGSGGREHALVWKIAQSPRVEKIYCAPGNGGMEGLAKCIDIGATDIKKLLEFAQAKKIDLTIVGPESSLVAGIVDLFENHDLRIFGPTKAASILEGSKVFTKEFLAKYDIPTARFQVFTESRKAKSYIERCGAPIVVKADGLAAGKGVIVATTIEEAKEAVDTILTEKVFGSAGKTVVIEECLTGEEASFIAFTDGKTVLPLPSSQDHKAIYDNDKGPNTGGMGAYSPAPVVTAEIEAYVMEHIMRPTVEGMAREGRPFKGMLYAGLMIDGDSIKVLEFNCRFGDPEAQPLLMRLKTDIIDIFEAAIDGKLASITMRIDPRPTVCVVMAAGGYPGSYPKGLVISGIAKATKVAGVEVFFAGAARKGGKTVTDGGRVLGVTACGDDLQGAIDGAYEAVRCISWEGCYYRQDIGAKAIRRLARAGRRPLVGILMGSDSDLPVMKACADFFKEMEIGYEMTVASAHRTPEKAMTYARTAQERGVKILIAGAGMAAHLAGVVSAHTDLPVIGVPLDGSSLQGMDALLATVQMPPGIPVATMGIGKAGAKNSGVLAARILALGDPELAARLVKFREKMVKDVEEKAKRVEEY
ncbi:MAG: phosphoribosylamine--glycine ligase [Desulfopila sp.]